MNEQKENQEINNLVITDASQKLVPWWSSYEDNILKFQTEQNPKNYLDSYYLFPLKEIFVNSDCDDIAKFINERFQNILASASHSSLSVAIILSSKNGNSDVFLGFKNNSSLGNNPDLFESIVNGILPGKKIKLEEAINLSSLVDGYNHGGIVTGVPTVKKDDENQKFNLSSIVRSLYGKEYLLAIISRPISETEKQSSFSELIQLRDNLHTLAKQTISEEKGSGQSFSDTETSTTGSSQTRGYSNGGGIGFPTPIGFIGGGFSHSQNRSKTTTEGTSSGQTETFSEQESRSLSIEKQNGFALELEKIADQYIERMIRGFGSGYWETSITFATPNKITSDVLAGTFIGELSKPSDKLLPPPRIYSDNLEGKILFIPKISSSNTIFPKPLSSYLTSEELSLISSPPVESVPGYEIQKMPALALTDTGSRSEIVLGSIADHGNPILGTYLHLSKNDLNKHLFVCGLTGSGKTTTVKHILKNLVQNENIPFLVIESAKRDYRQLLADDVFKEKLNIFTIGNATVSPIRFNPFYIQEGVHPLVHIDYLKAIFNASFSLYGPMPSIVEKCLHTIYIQKGWDLTFGTHPNFLDKKGNYDGEQYSLEEHFYCFPTLTDLKDEIDRYIKTELDYKGELRDNIRTAIIVRLESLCVGAKGLMFNTHDFFSIEQLLSQNTILEMENLADDDDKAFFVGLILVLISEYRQKENPAVNPGIKHKGLQHFIVIEEAHRLLKNVETERTTEMMGNPKGKAVEVFCNLLAEMRSLGQGVAVVEQIPSKISPDVIKNSNTKIVHRLVSKDDQGLLAGSLSINDNDALYLNRLRTGHALCHKEGMGRPVECAILSTVTSHAISDEKVKRSMAFLTDKVLHGYRAYQLDTFLGEAGKELTIKFFNSLITLELNALNRLLDIAKKEIKKALIMKDIKFVIDDLIVLDYLSLRIMLLISKGIYCPSSNIPRNLKIKLLDFMKTPSNKTQAELINHLNMMWEPNLARDFIEDIIENLVIRYCYQKPSALVSTEVKNLVSSFLLLMDVDTIEKISQKVLNQMDANYV